MLREVQDRQQQLTTASSSTPTPPPAAPGTPSPLDLMVDGADDA
jgi:hypothetical protein